jgi:hypothetical protein
MGRLAATALRLGVPGQQNDLSEEEDRQQL